MVQRRLGCRHSPSVQTQNNEDETTDHQDRRRTLRSTLSSLALRSSSLPIPFGNKARRQSRKPLQNFKSPMLVSPSGCERLSSGKRPADNDRRKIYPSVLQTQVGGKRQLNPLI